MAKYHSAAFAFAAATIVGIHLSHPTLAESQTLTAPAAERGSGQRPSAASDCDVYAASDSDAQRRANAVPFDKIDPGLAVAACEAAVRQFPNDTRANFQLGRAYEKAGKLSAALSQYRKAAEGGFAPAQYTLGRMYNEGVGTTKDLREAAAWFRKAAEGGFAPAQYALGRMYYEGVGTAKDLREAAAWFRKAAEQNLPSGQYALGLMYQEGSGVPKDFSKAIALYRKAVEQSFAPAEAGLGFIYYNGLGVHRDLDLAFTWFKKSAEQGFARAQTILGEIYQSGSGVPKSFEQAVFWYRKAAEQDDALAQANLKKAEAELAAAELVLAAMSAAELKALQHRLTDDGCYQSAIDGQASPALETAVQECPAQDPVLRIETGMHVAKIFGIGVDRACQIAATASYDKTVRVWSLPDGRLLRTLRVPIGPGDGGKAYATAVSPDGRWVALGGYDARSDVAHQAYVYVFDAASGSLVARAGPFGDVIDSLAFSPDGRWLAATTGNGFGLHVIDAQSWSIIASDQAYAGDSHHSSVAFAPDGSLYTVAFDGKLRQYGPAPKFDKLREVATKGGRRPYSVAVDPRGQQLGVGFEDSLKVDFYDAGTLNFLFAAEPKPAGRGDLGSVAWSDDGTRLFAAGRYQIAENGIWKTPLLTFGRDGRRIGGTLPLGTDSIHGLQRCQDAIAVAGDDPAFGLVDKNGALQLWKTGVAPDMRAKIGDAFTIAGNGKQVRVGLGFRGDDPVVFDLAQATLINAPQAIRGFIAPATKGLPVDAWLNSPKPTFAGTPLQLRPFDEARSVAIRLDHSGFVLGTEWTVRAYDARGRELWTRINPAAAWGLNLSGDGRLIVAAYGDGTIRWLRWSDGQELLALFVNRKTREWVAWTPSGYYMASPGGEDLIGWHVNRGWNQTADFFPARYRPSGA
jgi:TPR repeat protein